MAVFTDVLLYLGLLQPILRGVLPMLNSKLRRMMLLAVALLVLLAAGYRAAVHAFAVMPLNLHPFTAEIEHYSMVNGVARVNTTDHIGRTSSGAQVNWGIPSGMNVEVSSVKLPDGWVGVMVDAIKAKSTGKRPEWAAAEHNQELTATPADCIVRLPGRENGLRKIGEEVVFTQTAYLLQQSGAVSNGKQMRVTFWAFPRYSCTKLQSKVEESDGQGNWTVVYGTRLSRLAEVSPPAEKFVIPLSYQEMPPSQQALKLAGPNPRLNGEQLDKIRQQSGDVNYQQWHR